MQTTEAPCAVVLNDFLYVFYKGVDPDSTIFVARSSDSGLTWYGTRLPDNSTTSASPADVASGSNFVVFYKLAGGDENIGVTVFSLNNAQWVLLG